LLITAVSGLISKDTEPTVGEPIAVIGMSCRLPQAGNPAGLWRLLDAGVDAVTEVPADRWPDAEATRFRRGGFLDRVDGFDADLFGVSPNEAAAMDPQQRLALELAWEAIEDARIAPPALRDSATGVYVGAIGGDYALLHDRLGASGPHTLTGTLRGLIANRVSHRFGLRGPSLTLDCGQSSSLVAVQSACEDLRRGAARLALAGGVNLNLLAATSAVIGEFGALSPDGRCHTFDSRANGYVRGEGGAVVLLKPLSAARADGDRVHGLILGGAVNHDGGDEGLTVPSARAQAEAIRLACRAAGVSPADVQYAELHGTGTRVGDPIEAAALGAALGSGRPERAPLLVGSVKTNIGHLEGAAGVAGLLKVLLSLKHRRLAPSLNFETPNPDIPLDALRLDVVRTARNWPAPDRRLIAGVSSFGVGGTNCHLVLAEAPRDTEATTRRTPAPAADGTPSQLLLSARSASALRAQARALSEHLAEHPLVETADVALSLARTRGRFEHRAVVLGEDRAGLATGLDEFAAGRVGGSAVIGKAVEGEDVFVFPGQGSQWPGMALGLLEASPVFARRLEECARALRPFLGYSPLDVLRGAPGAPGLDLDEVIQPALWAVMVSLAELWRAQGLEPAAVIGSSQGEIAAATVIGALTLEDAARVVTARSRIVGSRPGGGMLSVAAPLAAVEELLAAEPQVSLAVVNGPRSVVLSGPAEAIAVLREAATDRGYRAKVLPVGYASHSPAMDALREELLAAIAPIRPREASAVFVSAVTGLPMDPASLDAEYWFDNLRRPVRFADAVSYALEHGAGRFVECSPHPVLCESIEENAEHADREVAVLGTLTRDDGGLDRVRRALAQAWVSGAAADPAPGAAPESARLTDLPTYPFQRTRHWLDGAPVRRTVPGAASAEPLAPDTPPAAPHASRAELRTMVAGTAAALLGHRDGTALDASRTFKDLGFDSATTVELRGRLQALTGLRLPTSLLFDHPTVNRLADALHARIAGGTGEAAAPAAVLARAAEPTRAAESDPVVIVAMACRYPGGVTSPEELWRLVAEGGDAITGLPTNRGWNLDALFGPGDGRPGTCATRFGGFLHDADRFDAAFFGLSPREALAMDPQQRLLLETAWEALERAGIDPTGLAETPTGVFVGAMASDYGPRLHQPGGAADGHLLTGTATSVASGRIAYTFGLRGPAITVDTACSSSLVAIHLATQSLRRGECSLALAGGATLMSNPGNLVEFSRQNGLAVDGRCKAFAASADGTAFAEGAGMLLLERACDARRRGHRVLAVVRGVAVNSDGASNGLTAPNGLAQQQVIRQALADAGLRGDEVDALEAHGTGTALGDPIEADAVLATYGRDRAARSPLWLGSVKSNIGHTQAAAGVAGVIKMVMAMRHGVLPPTLHAAEPTAKVDWSRGRMRLLTRERPWDAPDRPRRAAVSSFGISGTNAHLVLEAAPAADESSRPQQPTRPAGPALVWVLSAQSAASLCAHAGRLRDYALTAAEDDLAHAGPELARRATFAHRAVVIASDRDELLAALGALAETAAHPCLHRGLAATDVRPVFVFPGQGAQWAGMAAELLEADPVFAAALGECADALRPHTGWSVLDVLTGAEGAPALEGTAVVQPTLFAVMVSLARRWRAAGVQPAAVVGHSQGEIAAAQFADALSLADAAKLVALRSRVLAGLDGTGGVLAVGAPAAWVGERLAPYRDRLWIAVDNGPSGTVVAGELPAIEEFAAACGDSVQLRRTPVAYAAHTPHVEVVREELLSLLGESAATDTETAICSSCLGDFVAGSALTADYWYRNVAQPVRFDAAIRAFGDGVRPLFIEVSPHPILAGAVQDILAEAGIEGGAVGTLRRGLGGPVQFASALAAAFVRGAPVAWAEVLGPVTRHLDLPTYAFDRQRYWLAGSEPGASVSLLRHPLLTAAVPVAQDGGVLLTGQLSLNSAPWLADHAVGGTVLLPGTGFVEIALRAATAVGADQIEDLTLHAPLPLPATGAVELQATLGGADEHGRRTLTVHSRPAGGEAPWTRHAEGALGVRTQCAADRIALWPPAGCPAIDLDGAYGRLAAHGYGYGPTFQGLTAAWRDGDDLYAEVRLPESPAADAEEFAVHPALLDAALHLLVLDAADAPGAADVLLPFSWSGVWLTAHGTDRLRVRLTRSHDGKAAVSLHDASGVAIGGVEELVLRPVPIGGLSAASTELYHLDWVEAAPYRAAEDRWAVLGSGAQAQQITDSLRADGFEPTCCADLDALPDPVPPVVVAPFPDGVAENGDPRRAVRTRLGQALELIQRWTSEDRFGDSRLLFLADPSSLTGAPLWGLVRSAATEHPVRFALADLGDAAEGSAALLASAVAAGESQCAVRDGRVLLPRVTRRSAAPSAPLDLGSGTVLVTGGTSGLGALITARLVERHGVRDLLLASRSGEKAPGAEELVRRLTALGASVRIAACDLADRAEVAALLAAIPPERPLVGVVHAAGVLDDATVTRLDERQLDRVLRPKLDAGWLLHELTAGMPVRAFVLFSSVAGVLGNAGQGNYAAANAFLDALAEHRRGLGLPAASVAWGLWSAPTGMTAGLAESDLARLAGAGIVPLTADDGLDLFDAVLSRSGEDGACSVAARWDAAGLRARAERDDIPPVLRGLVRAPRRAEQATATTVHIQGTFADRLTGLDRAEAGESVLGFVRDQVAFSLGHRAPTGIDLDRPFRDLGLDSLMSVELRNRLGAETGLRLPASLAFDHPTVTGLAGYLLGELVPPEPSAEQLLRQALDRITPRLAEADPAERERIAAALHDALESLGPVPGLDAPPSGPDLGSDEDMFAFIDARS
jgi:acyl transferase domain-containing protein